MEQQTEDEAIRRVMLEAINIVPGSREALEAEHGQVWDTEQLRAEFEATRFAAPIIFLRRRSDSQKGTMLFQHHPRFYWGWMVE